MNIHYQFYLRYWLYFFGLFLETFNYFISFHFYHYMKYLYYLIIRCQSKFSHLKDFIGLYNYYYKSRLILILFDFSILINSYIFIVIFHIYQMKQTFNFLKFYIFHPHFFLINFIDNYIMDIFFHHLSKYFFEYFTFL